MGEAVLLIIVLLAVVVFLLGVIAASLLFGSTPVLWLVLFLIVCSLVCLLGYFTFTFCRMLYVEVSEFLTLFFGVYLLKKLKKPPSALEWPNDVIERTVDITTRGASLRVDQLEAAGFRLNHRTGDVWHYVKQDALDG
jgi:hypothetical protein